MRKETHQDRRQEISDTELLIWRLNNWPMWAKFIYLHIPYLRQDLLSRINSGPHFTSRIASPRHWILGDIEHLRRS